MWGQGSILKEQLSFHAVFIFEQLAAGPGLLRGLKRQPYGVFGLVVYPNSDPSDSGNNSTKFIACTGPSTGRCARSPVICTSGAEPSPNTSLRRRRPLLPVARSKLIFKPTIAEFLEQDAHCRATVIAQRLRRSASAVAEHPEEYLPGCAPAAAKRAYVRMERDWRTLRVDWGHFDALPIRGLREKLYAFCLWNCHSRSCIWSSPTARASRLLFLYIMHFRFMGGIARTLFDNLATGADMTATWCVSYPVSGLRSRYGFLPALVMCERRGKKEK